MPHLTVTLLGSFTADLDGRSLLPWRSNRAPALLAYLLVEELFDPGRLWRRDTLTALLWPGLPEGSARQNLRQTLYLLRQTIPEVEAAAGSPVPLLLSDRTTVRLHPDARYELDVAGFHRALNEINPAANAAGVALYRGDLLADFFLADSNEFESWAAARRAALREKAVAALTTLAGRALDQADWAAAEGYARRQLQLDELREVAYQQLMQALNSSGQRTAALAAFEGCRQLLQQELGVTPSPETQALYEAIRLGQQILPSRSARQLRGYELRETIGAGGFGVVYRAHQSSVGREVAIKAIHRRYADDPEFANRFEAEARLIARLEHQHIVPLYDYWREPEAAYLVMRWMRGGNLAASIRQGRWSLAAVARLVEQIGAALAAAHRQQIIHRDLKPANILLDEEGNAYLSDFGIAKDLQASYMLTKSGDILGSLPYLAPEQLLGEPVGPQTDLYSLGLLIYELLAGERPKTGEALSTLLAGRLNEPLPSLHARWPDIPPAIDLVLQRATAPAIADRYPDVPALVAAFRQAVVGDDDTAVIPTPHRPPPGLPAELLPLIGREHDLAVLASLLADPAARLITLAGMGGIGKTRLALAVAHQSAANFADGVFFVPLAALRSADSLVPAIADALGFPFAEGGKPQQQLLDFLREKQLLLLLDNFDQVLDSAALVQSLLEAAPGLKVVTTSRERLNLQGEQVYPLQGLAYPAEGGSQPGSDRPDATTYAAGRLFLQCTGRVQPNWMPAAGDAADLAAICRLLGGVPLAIELAAGWIETLPLSGIRHELEHSLGLLETDLRDIPERHRSMRAVFDTSWQRLGEADRETFSRLSVFRGTFTRAAAEEVAGATLRALAVLVKKSLLTYSRPEDRYLMHEMVRQYAALRLAEEPGGNTELLDRHQSYYGALLRRLEAELKGARQQAALQAIEADIANIQQAWHRAVKRAAGKWLDRALGALAIFYEWRGRYEEGAAMFTRAAEKLVDSGSPSPLLLRLRARQATFERVLGRLAEAEQHLEHTLAGLERLPPSRLVAAERAYTLVQLGEIAYTTGRRSEAVQRLEAGLAQARGLKDRWFIAYILNRLGGVLWNMARYEPARSCFEESLALCQALGDQWGMAAALYGLGGTAVHLNRAAEGEQFLQECIRLRGQLGDRSGRAAGLQDLGALYIASGAFALARRTLAESVALFTGLGRHPEAATSGALLASTYALSGDYEVARNQAEQGLALAQSSGYERGIALNYWIIGGVDLAQGRYDAAHTNLERAVTLYRRIEQWDELACTLAYCGYLERRRGRPEVAHRHFLEALRAAVTTRGYVATVFTLPGVALLLADLGRQQQAAELYALIRPLPFLANAALFADVAGKELESLAAEAPHSSTLSPDLWQTAADLLAQLEESKEEE